jgi:hypothetical protein
MTDEETAKMKTNEEFYDAEIAPVLAALGRRCIDRGMSLVAAVGNSEDTYSSRFIDLSIDNNPNVRLNYYANRARGNVDALFMRIESDAEKYGGDKSIVLWQLKHYRRLIDPDERTKVRV